MKRLEWIASHLEPTDRVLEIGCGTGFMITIPLLRAGWDARGIDTHQESINYGKELLREAGFEEARLSWNRAETLTDSYDAVIVSEVLEHLPDEEIRSMLRTIRSLLAHSGKLLVTVPNGYGLFEAESLLWSRAGLGRFMDRSRLLELIERAKTKLTTQTIVYPHPSSLDSSPHMQRFTLGDLVRLMDSNGFSVQERRATVLIGGPISNLLFTGFKCPTAINRRLADLIPAAATGFMVCAILRTSRHTAQSNANEDVKERTRAVWGASPAGTTLAGGAEPGTREFFETARRRRSVGEMAWLPKFFQFEGAKDKRVLEVGCGAGFDALAFIEAAADYTGLDITPENVDRTRAHLRLYDYTPELVRGDAENLPFADASFDIVFSNGVLHHTPHTEKAFAEAYRVLRPGGEFWIAVYHRDSVFYWGRLFLYDQIIKGGRRERTLNERLAQIEFTTSHERPLVRTLSRRQVRELLRNAGYEVASVSVRKLAAEDFPLVIGVNCIVRRTPQRILDRLGHTLGWYVAARATKPNEGSSDPA
ncbi:MAG: methyltransferase domain-containing protein [Thermoleophilia bacterium]